MGRPFVFLYPTASYIQPNYDHAHIRTYARTVATEQTNNERRTPPQATDDRATNRAPPH